MIAAALSFISALSVHCYILVLASVFGASYFYPHEVVSGVYLLIFIVISGGKCVLFQQNVINVDRIKCTVMDNMGIEMQFKTLFYSAALEGRHCCVKH